MALLTSTIVVAGPVAGQDAPRSAPDRAKVLAAAREIMAAQQFCALATVDPTGRPQVRTVNPFPPDDEMIVWMATTIRSRKVEEIRKDPRVSLYYADHSKATGYVSLAGRAILVQDMREVMRRKRAYWDSAFPGLKDIVLIKVVPERLEVVNYKYGMANDPVTFRATSITLPR
jgi:general stress protein 26